MARSAWTRPLTPTLSPRAGRGSARAVPAASTTPADPSPLLQLIRHLGEPRARAGLVLVLTGRAAHADGADGLVADHDRQAAAERDDVGEHALAHKPALGGALRPLGRGAAEGARRVGLAAGELGGVRRRAVAAQE